MPNVKGSAFASRILWVSLNHGEAGADRLSAAVSPGLARIIQEGAVMSKWYPFDHFVELSVAIDATFGRGDLTLVREQWLAARRNALPVLSNATSSQPNLN